MKLRTLAALSVATLAVSFAAPAVAQETMGLRFETGGALTGQTLIAGDIRVGYDLEGGFTPLIGLTLRGQEETDFVLNLEGRYYFREHKKGLSPFIVGGLDIVTLGVADETNIGLNAGFGLEYLFSKSFGVGGKWGLNLVFVDDADNAWGTASSMYLVWRL